MAALGVFFAVTKDLGNQACAQADAEAVADLMDDHHTALSAAGWVQSTDRAWDAIHRCLTDGRLEHGYDVEHSCVLGSGEFGYDSEDWIINVLDADEVREAAEYLRGIGEAELRQRYAAIDPASYCFRKSPEDFESTRHWFAQLRAFYQRAAEAGRWVVFLADQ
jgi:hypothetical protein